MQNDIVKLKEEFKNIKEMGMVKSLRKGYSGVGYTFESLLNKKEDQECKPDYGSIELKTHLGYSNSDLSLFNLTPMRDYQSAIFYIFKKYSYFRYGNRMDYKMFSRNIYKNQYWTLNNYYFKLDIDYKKERILMNSYYHDEFYETVCEWNFKEIYERLNTKLKTLAIVDAYPYLKNGELYYKFLKLNIYQLKDFNLFLKLINEDKIYVSFYMREGVNKLGDLKLENHGVSFKIKRNFIEILFDKI